MTRIAIVAPTRDALEAIEQRLAADPQLTIVERSTRLEDVLDASLAAAADVALVSVDELSRLRTVLAGHDDHAPGPPPLVVLCDPDAQAAGRSLVRLGVRALLPNNAGMREITAALEAASAGLVAFTPEALDGFVPAHARERNRPSTNGTSGHPLSPREREVLALIAEGLGNKTVAARLGISEHTVKTHIAGLFAKLGAESRAEAVAIGARQGLLLF